MAIYIQYMVLFPNQWNIDDSCTTDQLMAISGKTTVTASQIEKYFKAKVQHIRHITLRRMRQHLKNSVRFTLKKRMRKESMGQLHLHRQ